MTDAEIIAALREQLDEANETILQFREERRRMVLVSGAAFDGPVLFTRAEWAICETLYRMHGVVHWEVLAGAIGAVMRKPRSPNDNSLKVLICKLRKKLAALSPPVLIKTRYGEGFYFDPEARTAFEQLRSIPRPRS